jgi:hypothetical protein
MSEVVNRFGVSRATFFRHYRPPLATQPERRAHYARLLDLRDVKTPSSGVLLTASRACVEAFLQQSQEHALGEVATGHSQRFRQRGRER